MSALPPKADIRQRIEHVCFVPIADIGSLPDLTSAIGGQATCPGWARHFDEHANWSAIGSAVKGGHRHYFSQWHQRDIGGLLYLKMTQSRL